MSASYNIGLTIGMLLINKDTRAITSTTLTIPKKKCDLFKYYKHVISEYG